MRLPGVWPYPRLRQYTTVINYVCEKCGEGVDVEPLLE
jgi:hypothetical protein